MHDCIFYMFYTSEIALGIFIWNEANFVINQKNKQQKQSRILKTALKTLKERVQDKSRVAKQKEKELEEMVTSVKLSRYFQCNESNAK